MEFIATVIGLLILLFVIEKITNKILSIEKKKISETSGSRINRLGQTVLFILLLFLLWFMIESSDIQGLFYFTTYLALLFGYQAVMEFIFIKSSRQYISTTILLIIVLVVVFNLNRYPFF
ncbi:DUF4181 domain-containing protein [Robertmurraya sp. DFI.2.37]|uniref:DUF4181 domain-containing protein n=1 Tax=Robertmurraya sp. DFI.2.37 TaxID=3031819 RepID=UPI001245A51C|nr:DUF4181 domain-containing protein [Robertmurraya sp. DFI.2.37]MDF1509908.1 DUF4181 domain-containing protein [Robertmurraya sp. DFI.2.37]